MCGESEFHHRRRNVGIRRRIRESQRIWQSVKSFGISREEPEDLVSIERYLGSGAIKGIGQTMASRIVKKFREDTFRIIEEEPERLAEIKGISERKAMEIASQMEEKKDMRKSMIYLQKYGISTKLAAKIYQRYGMKVHQILEEKSVSACR